MNCKPYRFHKFGFLVSCLICLTLVIAIPSWAEQIYITQTSNETDAGAECTSAHSVAWFNTPSNWANPKEPGKVGPGDTVHLCGTITSALIVQGSGSLGSPITIFFEASSKISMASCGTGCLSTNSKSYLAIDGGSNGIIEATNMGTGKANSQSVGINAMSCSNCEIKNLTIKNMYVRTSASDTLGGGDASAYPAIMFSGSDFSFHDNAIRDVGWAIRNLYGESDDNVRIYNNDISNCAHAYALAASGGVINSGKFYYYNNYVHDFAVWDSSGCSVAHTSAIHAYGINGSKVIGTLWIYNNRFAGTGSCMTANIFLEGGADAWTDGRGSAKIFNNFITATGYVTGLVQPNNGTNHEIYNNTIIGDGSFKSIGLIVGGSTTNAKIKNNFIGSCGHLIHAYATESIDAGLELDNNMYANCDGYNCFWVGSTNTGSFDTYRTALPDFDSHSVNDLSSSTGGLNSSGIPQAGSPVIGAGANLTILGTTALKSDIVGTARPTNSAWDIGAYQVGSSFALEAPTDLRIP